MSDIDDGAPLLFIHGIKGGHLRDGSGRRWVGVKQALGLDRRPLSSPLGWSDGKQDTDDLVPDGPIANVLWVPIYKPFLQAAARRHPTFVEFSYDWRREIPESADRLIARLEQLAAEHGRPARVIAHSMGGLVTLHALRRRPELTCGVLFAGTPFGTGIGFARDTHLGAPVGLNKSILGVEAANTWAAHWVFFPHGPDAHLREGTRSLDHDWYDVASWEHHKLGVFAGGVPGVDAYRAHLAEALPRARETRRLLEDPGALAGAGVPIAILRSGDHDTPDTVVKDGPKAVRGWDVDSVEYVPGDHRVKTANAEPPGLEFEAFHTAKAHDSLLDDHAQVEAALGWLVGQG